MANALYDKGRDAFATKLIDWVADAISAVLVRTGVGHYVVDTANDQFLSAIASGDRISTVALAGKATLGNGVCDASDPTFLVVPAGVADGAIVFYLDTGNPATSRLIAYMDTATGLPVTPATLTDHTSLDLFVGRSFSAPHTGGTGLTLTGNNNKTRASMGASLFSDMRIATTAALGGGTVTLDSQAISQSLRKGNRVNPAAATEEVVMPQMDGLNYNPDLSQGEHPQLLTTNEGLVLRNRTVWPAAGTAIVLVEMAWAEIAAY